MTGVSESGFFETVVGTHVDRNVVNDPVEIAAHEERDAASVALSAAQLAVDQAQLEIDEIEMGVNNEQTQWTVPFLHVIEDDILNNIKCSIPYDSFLPVYKKMGRAISENEKTLEERAQLTRLNTDILAIGLLDGDQDKVVGFRSFLSVVHRSQDVLAQRYELLHNGRAALGVEWADQAGRFLTGNGGASMGYYRAQNEDEALMFERYSWAIADRVEWMDASVVGAKVPSWAKQAAMLARRDVVDLALSRVDRANGMFWDALELEEPAQAE